ncbi:MAG: zinc ribbon domain-containing protein [Promethearchaeota archaeon]
MTITATLEILSDSSLGFIVLGLVFVTGVGVGIFFLVKRKSKSQPPLSESSFRASAERHCPDCGKVVPSDLNFCGNCGARLTLTLLADKLNETLDELSTNGE